MKNHQETHASDPLTSKTEVKLKKQKAQESEVKAIVVVMVIAVVVAEIADRLSQRAARKS